MDILVSFLVVGLIFSVFSVVFILGRDHFKIKSGEAPPSFFNEEFVEMLKNRVTIQPP